MHRSNSFPPSPNPKPNRNQDLEDTDSTGNDTQSTSTHGHSRAQTDSSALLAIAAAGSTADSDCIHRGACTLAAGDELIDSGLLRGLETGVGILANSTVHAALDRSANFVAADALKI